MSRADEQRGAASGAEAEREGVHLEAYASGEARINQAGRDQHFYYGEGVRVGRRTQPADAVHECPYPGLTPFGPDQARWFFGRDQLVAELTDRLDERLRIGGLQVVVAPSGAGKSSLLRAGLLPKLDHAALPGSDRWPKLVFTPTDEPVRSLRAQLASIPGLNAGLMPEELPTDPHRLVSLLGEVLRGQGPAARILVVVDQFEELFTACDDDGQRRTFIDLLARLAGTRSGSDVDRHPIGLVVVSVRADFYAACADYPPVRGALQDGPVVVGPLSEAELREAIVYPAQDVGLEIEAGLVELLLRDLGATTGGGGTGGYEAGRLPLLAHALRAIWQQRHGVTLTVPGYQATGGIQRAIALTADRVFTSLDRSGQRIAQTMFLRLIRIGEATDDTRRRLIRTDLLNTATDAQVAATVVDAFTAARLLTQRQDTVEITHEALLQSWPRLRRWIDTDRAGRLTHQDLEDAASAWERGGRDSSLLYRGSRLEVARAWVSNAESGDLSSATHAFLAASARQWRRTRQLRNGTVAVLVTLALLASVTAVVAFQQRAEALHQRREALRQRDLATYNRVLAEADQLRSTDVSLSAQLDLVAHRMRPNDDTHTRLMAAGHTALPTPLAGHTDNVDSAAFSPDGRTLASGSEDQSVRLWNVSDPARPVHLSTLAGHTSWVNKVAFSPDGQVLATASADRTVRLWNVANPAHAVPLGDPLTGHNDSVISVFFSPDGRTLATASADRTVRLWEVSDPARPVPRSKPLTGHASAAWSICFSPTGRTLAVGDDNSVRLWDISNPTSPAVRGKLLNGHTGTVWALAFSPDGGTLASGSIDSTVRLWRVADATQAIPLGAPLIAHSGAVGSVAFSPDGHTLASGSNDQSILLWNISNPDHFMLLGRPLTGHTNTVRAVAFSPDGQNLASTGNDRLIRLWHLPQSMAIGRTNGLIQVVYSPVGHTLASAGTDGVQLWSTPDAARVVPLGRPITGATTNVRAVAFSPDGRTLSIARTGDDAVELWNLTGPAHPVRIGYIPTGHTASIFSV